MILLVVQCVVAGLIILGLYHFGRSFGLAALLVYIIAIQFLQNLITQSVFLEVLDGVVVSPGSAVLFSSTLMALLLVAIRAGVPSVRRLLYAVVAANLLLTLILGATQAGIDAGVLTLASESWVRHFGTRSYLFGTGLLLLDVMLLVILDRALARLRLPLPVRTIGILVIVLCFDGFVFVLAATDLSLALLPGQLLGKGVAGVVYGTLLAAYLGLAPAAARKPWQPADDPSGWRRQVPTATGASAVTRSVRLVLPAGVLVGIAATAVVFALSRKAEDDRLMADVRRDSTERVSSIADGLAHHIDSLVALESLYVTVPEVDQAVFAGFTQSLLQHDPAIRALEWVERVSQEDRESFEASVRRAGNPGFEITERNPQGQLVRAGERPEYFPVTFVEPLAGNEAAFGYDLASEPTRRAALTRARLLGTVIASAPIALVQKRDESPGFLVFKAVHQGGAARPDAQLEGFLVGVFLAADVVDTALAALEPRGIDVAVYDQSASGTESLLHFHSSRTRKPDLVHAGWRELRHDPLYLLTEDIAVADRTWRIATSPTPEYLAAGRSWLPWGFVTAGLLLTGAFAVYMVLLSSSAEQASRLSAEIEQSEERYRGLVDSTFDGVATSENGVILEASQAFADTFGYRLEELSGKPVSELVDPDHLEDVAAKIAAQYDKPYESVCVRKNGTRFPVEVCGRPVPYGGRMARVAAIRDISARKRAEAELSALEQRYRSLFQQAPEMYVLTAATPDGPVILDCNESFVETLGYSREEVLGRPLADFYSAESKSQMLELGDYELALKGELLKRERQLVTRGGNTIHTILRASPETGPQGMVVGTRAIYVDITERKHTETLVRRSRERLRKLAARLETVREEERKSLARQMHDELGQALTAVRIDLSWMQSQVTDKPRLVERVTEMRGIIDGLVDTVRDLSARLRPHVLDTLGLAPAIEWELERFAQRSGMSCTFEASADGAGDLDGHRTTAVFRIFQEALTNIARHAGARQVQVHLRSSPSGLELEVLDDGRGIGDEEISSVYSSGLIGMRERAGALAGRLEVGRRPEGGTRLWMRIPP